VVKKAGENYQAAARKVTRYLETRQSRDEIIYNDSNSKKNQEKLKK
jgi:hypothetical protein